MLHPTLCKLQTLYITHHYQYDFICMPSGLIGLWHSEDQPLRTFQCPHSSWTWDTLRTIAIGLSTATLSLSRICFGLSPPPPSAPRAFRISLVSRITFRASLAHQSISQKVIHKHKIILRGNTNSLETVNTIENRGKVYPIKNCSECVIVSLITHHSLELNFSYMVKCYYSTC